MLSDLRVDATSYPSYSGSTADLKIPAGMWTVREIPVSRYALTGIREVENGEVEGEKVILDTKDHDTAKATFCNTLTNYSEFSHNDVEINFFGKQVGR